MPEIDLAHAFDSPVTRAVLGAIGLALLVMLVREVRHIPSRLLVLMATAFVDMVGVFLIIPLVPFYLTRFAGNGLSVFGQVVGVGVVSGFMASAFTAAQSLSAPFWGRFSDRFGRRPALMVALCASAIAYVLFGFAGSLAMLFLSRLVQGAGGGTVGVIQAYVADSTAPEERARALGWLSAATNLGVALGPVIGWSALWLDQLDLCPGEGTLVLGGAAPGLLAALICLCNMALAWKYLPESNPTAVAAARPPRKPTGQAVWQVVSRVREPSSRLIWTYAIAIGAFQGTGAVLGLFLIARFKVTEATINWFYMYQGAISVFARVLLLGRMLDRFGEARLSRLGIVLLATGVCGLPFAGSLGTLALTVGLIPLGTAFTFPCVTGLLSRVVAPQDRGLYMGVQQTFGGAMRMAMPLLYGVLFDHVGIGSPFLFAAGFVLATLPLGFGLGHLGGRRGPKA